MGLAGLEHGIGEVLQGSVAPDGVMIESWPDSAAFDLLSGEPAITIVPNLLMTGLLAILVSLVFIVWATMFVHRRHGGLVLILLSIAMLLVGGGLNPPVFGILLGIVATRIDAPLAWWRMHLSGGMRRSLARLWLWTLVAGVIAWLSVLPGTALLDYFFAVSDQIVVYFLLFALFCALGLLLLTIFAGFAHDLQLQTQTGLRQEFPKGG